MAATTQQLAAGIIGVGNMGGAMAANLLERCGPVAVCDLVPERVDALAALGARPCRSGAELAACCALVVVCVVDAAQTADVLFGDQGAAQALRPGQTVMLCPTIGPSDTESMAARLLALGVAVIDAPMSGGPARARDGSMSLMVACADAAFDQHEALLRTIGSRLFRISKRPGDGARAKLVNNLLAGINLVGASEALALAESLGLPLDTMLGVFEQSSGQSWIGSDRLRRALEADYAPRAHLTLLQKDTGLAIAAAREAGFAGPLGAAARDTFDAAAAAGLAGQDDAVIFEFLRQRR